MKKNIFTLVFAFFGCPIMLFVFLVLSQGMLFIREHSGFLGVGIAFILAWLFLGIMGSIKKQDTPAQHVERAYLIHRKRDGYPMTVNKSQLDKALATGDYTYEGPAETGGYYYSGDGYQNVYIPSGYRIAKGQNKIDKRLN